jgi:hypothetical protein
MTTPVHAAPAFEDHVPPTFQPQPAVPLPVYEQQGMPQIADQEAVTSVQVPKGGYAQRITRISMNEFRLEGQPELWVEMRNPGLMAPNSIDEITDGLKGMKMGDDGEPVSSGDTKVILETMGKMLRRWCMWDATSDEDEPPMLPETVTLEMLGKAPLGVLAALGKAFKELQNPQ